MWAQDSFVWLAEIRPYLLKKNGQKKRKRGHRITGVQEGCVPRLGILRAGFRSTYDPARMGISHVVVIARGRSRMLESGRCLVMA